MQAVESLHFDRILLSKAYKDLDEKIQKKHVLWHWRVMQSLKKNWLLVRNMTWGIWWTLTRAVESPKTCTLMGCFCRKYICNVWARKIQRSCVVNVFFGQMYFSDQSSRSSFNFLDFPLLVWSCLKSSCDFWNKESVFI